MKIHVGAIIILCSTLVMAERINVAVAANVSYAMDALKQAFHRQHPTTEVSVILGSTGTLAAQIQHGAPYDVFMAADMSYPQKLYAKGLGLSAPQVYAKGSLAYFSTKDQNITQGMALLKSSAIHTIAIANPKTAPYGAAALQALHSANVHDTLASKLIFGESISQTVAYTMHAADIGIIATSVLYSPKMRAFRKGVHWSDVNTALYSPIEQGIILLNKAKHSQAAKDFYSFVFSTEAQAVFKAFGYALP